MDIYKSFNIEGAEKKSATYLIIQSIFFGFYFGTMDIVSHTLFLETFNQEDISKAYVVSGIIGVILTSLYSFAQHKIRFSRFSIYNLLVVAVLTIALRLGFEFLPEKIIVFVIFVLFYPLFILAMLGYWGSVTRIYNLRQGKRLFGVIDSGLILGIILSSFAIPFILTTSVTVVDLLIFSIVGTIAALFIQFIISGTYLKTKNNGQNTENAEKIKVNFFKLAFQDAYIRLMALFIFLSVITGFFIQYSFLGTTKEKYPEEVNFAQFFGAFMGIIMTVSLIVKTTVYSKLLKTYGLKVSLVISPVILLFFSVLAAFSGSVFGFEAVSGGFIFFFLSISLSKLMNKTLKDSIEIPAFKLLYQSLSSNIRYNVQAKIDGTVNEISALAGGLALMALGFLGFIKLVHYSFVLVIILALWTYISLKLYKSYKNSLNKSLETVFEGDPETVEDPDIFKWFKIHFPQLKTDQKIRGLNLLKILKPASTKDLNEMIAKHKAAINEKEPALLSAFSALDINALKKSETIDDAPGLSTSQKTEDRIKAAKLISYSNKQHDDVLLALLRDFNAEVKTQAILACTNTKNKNIIQLLVDSLFSDDLYIAAFHTLISTGKACVHYLELAFYKTGITRKTQCLIVKLLMEIESRESTNFLQVLLFHNDRQIVKITLEALKKRRFTIPGPKRYMLNQQIIKHVETIAWNMNTMYILSDAQDGIYNMLRDSFEKEQKENFETLFNYLSIAYDQKSVNHVRENLEKGSAESGSFAIELLDLFIDEELKPFVLPVLEDIPDIEKIRMLQNEFPLKKNTVEEQIVNIINRDYQKISIWSKACAMNCVKSITNEKTKAALISNIFNPNSLLAEVACLNLQRFMEKEELEKLLKRAGKLKKGIHPDIPASILEKILFLKNLEIFNNVPNKLLVTLASGMDEISSHVHQKEINKSFSRVNLAFVVTGIVVFRSNDELIEFKKGELIDFNYYDLNTYSIDMDENTKLFAISKNMMVQTSFEYGPLAQLLITLPINNRAHSVA